MYVPKRIISGTVLFCMMMLLVSSLTACTSRLQKPTPPQLQVKLPKPSASLLKKPEKPQCCETWLQSAQQNIERWQSELMNAGAI